MVEPSTVEAVVIIVCSCVEPYPPGTPAARGIQDPTVTMCEDHGYCQREEEYQHLEEHWLTEGFTAYFLRFWVSVFDIISTSKFMKIFLCDSRYGGKRGKTKIRSYGVLL